MMCLLSRGVVISIARYTSGVKLGFSDNTNPLLIDDRKWPRLPRCQDSGSPPKYLGSRCSIYPVLIGFRGSFHNRISNFLGRFEMQNEEPMHYWLSCQKCVYVLVVCEGGQGLTIAEA